MAKLVYLSGKVSGLTKEQYTDLFQRAADLVSAAGMEPVNPIEVVLDKCAGVAECGGEGEIHHWTCYMKHDLRDMLVCDGVVVLPNWTQSTGAGIEVDLADRLGMPIWAISRDWTEVYEWRNHE
jgi:hypothetical protein